MAEIHLRRRVTTDGPAYLGWRAAALAELAVVRVPELVPFKRPKGSGGEFPFDYLVTAGDEPRFFLVARGFGSLGEEHDPSGAANLECAVDADLVRAARGSAHPVVFFLFDADRDPGRFLRIDTEPEPPAAAKTVPLVFPDRNAITADSVRELATGLGANLARTAV